MTSLNCRDASIIIDRPLKLVFFGAPAFAEPALQALAEGPDQVVMVVTQPDRPAGRGCRTCSPPIKALAASLGLNVFQPSGLASPDVLKAIAGLEPDLLVVAAYGCLLPPSFLALGHWPPVNVHPSLLPLHRGPAPAPWAIINEDQQTGMSIIFLDEGMDSGPILKQTATTIGPLETGGELEKRLSRLGANLLLQAIAELKTGALKPKLQEHSLATINRLLTKQDGLLNWAEPASSVAARIRGTDPWPGAYSFMDDRLIKFFGALAIEGSSGEASPGQVLGLINHEAAGEFLAVAAGRGRVLISSLQPEGKRRLSAREFACGYHPNRFACPGERHGF